MAQATVITFDSLANNGRGYYDLAGPYVESGFQFSSSINSGGISFFTSGSGNTNSYAGSASLANAWGAGVTTLSSVSGAAFNLSSIELATGFKSLGTAASVTYSGPCFQDNSLR